MVVNILDFKNRLENSSLETSKTSVATIGYAPGTADDRSQCKVRATQYASTWPGVSHGQRNSQAYYHAAQLREKFGLTELDIIELVRQWNDLNYPPLSDEELVSAINNADKYAQKSAGSGYTCNSTRSNAVKHSPADPWPELVRFDEKDLPVFPLDKVPPCLKGFYTITKEIARSVQVAPDMPANILLSVIAAALGGKIKVITNNHYSELANLYVAVFSPSGTRKSNVFNILSRPLFDYQKRLRNDMSAEIEKNKSEKKILESRRKSLENEIIKSDGSNSVLEDELSDVITKLANFNKPVIQPTLILSDTTNEAMALCMANNNGQLCILDHEGIFFNNISGRYKGKGEMPSNDLILKAYSGDCYSDHRLTRESVHIDKPVLSIGLCVQPTVIEHLRYKEFLNETGLLPRFIATVPRDTVGEREAKTSNIPEYILDDYDRTINELLNIRKRNSDISLKLDDDADGIFISLFYDIEKRMAEDGDLYAIRPWAAKLCGHVARIAAVLHCFAYPELDTLLINGETMKFAVTIGYYLIEHIKAIYQIMQIDPAIHAAKRIIKWIKRNEKKAFTKTEVFNAMKNSNKNIQKASDFSEPLEILNQHGYLRLIEPEQKTGRPSEVYQVNPDVFRCD